MGDTGTVAAWLADHDGVIGRTEAFALGMSRHQIDGRVSRGEWVVMARGVYRCVTHPFSEAALVRGAVLAHGGVADRSTAAWWHGLVTELAAPLTISAPHATTGERWSHTGVDLMRRSFLPADVADCRGLAVTGKPLTVLLAAAGMEYGARLIDRTLQTRAVVLQELRDALDRNSGRWGLAAARHWLAIASGDTESYAERLFAKLLRSEGITGWVEQLPIAGWRIDFAWPELRLAVEIDGWAYHSSLDSFRSDRQKDNALQAAGWARLHFTLHDLEEDPIGCAEKVAAMLSAQAIQRDC